MTIGRWCRYATLLAGAAVLYCNVRGPTVLVLLLLEPELLLLLEVLLHDQALLLLPLLERFEHVVLLLVHAIELLLDSPQPLS